MRVTVEERPELEQTEVVVRCRRMDAQVSRLVELLRLSDARLVGERDGQTCILDEDDVLYIDTVDRGTFLYTADGVYESHLRLYELEEQLKEYLFVRISKSAIVNLKNIKSIRTYINRRLLITLNNGEQLIASRQYADAIRKLLDTKGKAD